MPLLGPSLGLVGTWGHWWQRARARGRQRKKAHVSAVSLSAPRPLAVGAGQCPGLPDFCINCQVVPHPFWPLSTVTRTGGIWGRVKPAGRLLGWRSVVPGLLLVSGPGHPLQDNPTQWFVQQAVLTKERGGREGFLEEYSCSCAYSRGWAGWHSRACRQKDPHKLEA